MLVACVSALAIALPPGVYTPTQFAALARLGKARLEPPGAVSPSKAQGAAPPGYNKTYGYPDGIGGLIVEGPFPYHNGPPSWSEANPTGAYGTHLRVHTVSALSTALVQLFHFLIGTVCARARAQA